VGGQVVRRFRRIMATTTTTGADHRLRVESRSLSDGRRLICQDFVNRRSALTHYTARCKLAPIGTSRNLLTEFLQYETVLSDVLIFSVFALFSLLLFCFLTRPYDSCEDLMPKLLRRVANSQSRICRQPEENATTIFPKCGLKMRFRARVSDRNFG